MSVAVVDILLATYNGARFLREQLDSIVGQTYAHWRLLVRDAGSSDGTAAILEEYHRPPPLRQRFPSDQLCPPTRPPSYIAGAPATTPEGRLFPQEQDASAEQAATAHPRHCSVPANPCS